eukprot:scaffold41_cov370-Pavlova_lutheri.AAC.5
MASMTAWKILGAEDRCLEELGKAWRSPPEGATLRLVGPAEDVQFLVGRNFDVLMRYNPSQKYAATVSVLSDKIQRRLEEDFNGEPAPDEACPSVPQPKPERPEGRGKGARVGRPVNGIPVHSELGHSTGSGTRPSLDTQRERAKNGKFFTTQATD